MVVRQFVTSLYNSATLFQIQLLLWLQHEDISVFLTLRVNVMGANQYVSIYINYVQMNYLVLCFFPS